MKNLILFSIILLFSGFIFSQKSNPDIGNEQYLIVKVRDSIVYSENVTNILGHSYEKNFPKFTAYIKSDNFNSTELLELFQKYGFTSKGSDSVSFNFQWYFEDNDRWYTKPLNVSSSHYPSKCEGKIREAHTYVGHVYGCYEKFTLRELPSYITIYIKEVKIDLK